MGNHPDDRMQPEVIEGRSLNIVWKWANAELQQAMEQLERDRRAEEDKKKLEEKKGEE